MARFRRINKLEKYRYVDVIGIGRKTASVWFYLSMGEPLGWWKGLNVLIFGVEMIHIQQKNMKALYVEEQALFELHA